MRVKPELKRTYGKNGLPELTTPKFFEHIAYTPLAIFHRDPDSPRTITRISIACKVSDADLRDN